jgi:hypothetical protein
MSGVGPALTSADLSDAFLSRADLAAAATCYD